jgi:hypothetical protein
MAARGAKGDPALAVLARERQDLVAEWQDRDAVRIAAVSQTLDRKGDQTAEATNLARLQAIDKRIGEIDQRFKDNFPETSSRTSIFSSSPRGP